jgi:hypothetical protein
MVEAICHCSGGEVLNDESTFQLSTASAKQGPDHEKTDSIKAWQKLARQATEPWNEYSVADCDVALASIDPEFQMKELWLPPSE